MKRYACFLQIIFFIVLPFLLISCGGCSLFSPYTDAPEIFSVMTYNVQNLFDAKYDGSEYPDYDPSGGDWNEELFHQKLLAISDVLSLYPTGGADIILLQEVENLHALDVLRSHYLKGGGYKYAAISDGEGQAVNCAVLSRFPIIEVKSHSVSVEGEKAGRPILECRVNIGSRELVLFNSHWKSKSGGAEETENLRRAAAALVRRRLEEVGLREPSLSLMVAGDLNECADEWCRVDGRYQTALKPYEDFAAEAGSDRQALYLTGDFSSISEEPQTGVLFSPWLEGCDFSGSYAYKGEWETIDHFLLNRSFSNGEGIEYRGFQVLHPDELLNSDGYPWAWTSYSGSGYSDHLPLLLECSVEGE